MKARIDSGLVLRKTNQFGARSSIVLVAAARAPRVTVSAHTQKKPTPDLIRGPQKRPPRGRPEVGPGPGSSGGKVMPYGPRVAFGAIAMLAALTPLGPAAAQTKLKWAHVYEVAEPYHTEALWAAEEIKKRTNGRY